MSKPKGINNDNGSCLAGPECGYEICEDLKQRQHVQRIAHLTAITAEISFDPIEDAALVDGLEGLPPADFEFIEDRSAAKNPMPVTTMTRAQRAFEAAARKGDINRALSIMARMPVSEMVLNQIFNQLPHTDEVFEFADEFVKKVKNPEKLAHLNHIVHLYSNRQFNQTMASWILDSVSAADTIGEHEIDLREEPEPAIQTRTERAI